MYRILRPRNLLVLRGFVLLNLEKSLKNTEVIYTGFNSLLLYILAMFKKALPKDWGEEHPTLLNDLRFRYIYHTNAIEGNSLSLIETKVILSDGITVGGKKLSEHLEAINQSDALAFIEQSVKKNIEISQSFIRELHYYVLKHNEEHRGKYRSNSVFIEGSSTMPALPSTIQPRLDSIMKPPARKAHINCRHCCSI